MHFSFSAWVLVSAWGGRICRDWNYCHDWNCGNYCRATGDPGDWLGDTETTENSGDTSRYPNAPMQHRRNGERVFVRICNRISLCLRLTGTDRPTSHPYPDRMADSRICPARRPYHNQTYRGGGRWTWVCVACEIVAVSLLCAWLLRGVLGSGLGGC